MRIGIDIDGVLTDSEQFELDYGSRYYYCNTSRKIENAYGYGSQHIFQATDQEDNDFWRKAIYQYIKEPARKFAAEVIVQLQKQGHKIYIITNRITDLNYCDITKEKMKKIVIKWLKQYNIHYDGLVFSNGTKLQALQDYQINIMIEDKPNNIIEQSKICRVFCFDARSNQDVKGDNIIRVYSWYDIYDKIKSNQF